MPNDEYLYRRGHGYSVLILWSEDDEAFLANVLELPGCVAHGDIREEALQNELPQALR